MWPDSPFAKPVSSYERPVPLVLVDPCDNPDVAIYVRSEWIPYILGSLKQLMLQTTWATNDPAALNLVQSRAATLLDCVAGSVAPIVCPETISEMGIEMSVCEQLRFQDGKLQGLCCGEWSDIGGQPAQGFTTGQPGVGSTQPPAGGGCASYKATLPGNGLFYVPTVVNTGDTIQITNLVGATYNPATAVAWFCGDGGQFFGGANVGLPVTDASNPMPAVPSGTVIAKIGSTFYDVHSGLFTVPAGVVNQSVTLQVNYASISGSAGTLEFDIQVCNNQLATWTHTFDFTLSPWGFTPRVHDGFSIGEWVPGIGWVHSDGYEASANESFRGIDIVRLGITPFECLSMAMRASITKGSYLTTGEYGQGLKSYAGAVGYDYLLALNPAVSDGSNVLVGPFYADKPSQTGLQVVNTCSTKLGSISGLSGSSAIPSLTITGKGPQPTW